MNEQLIDHVIELTQGQESSAHGSNKKCFLIDDYALLKQKFIADEVESIMQITEDLEKKGVNVARTLGFKITGQNIQSWDTSKEVLVSEGYVLQQRAKGTPLLDRTNWNSENKRYQIDYLKQIDSISKEGQDFFNQFVKSWLEIQNSGIRIDPSKPGNFIYEQGEGITFIDLGLSNQKPDLSIAILEQLSVILNMNAYNQCYPEVQQAVQGKLNAIVGKYKNAIVEQGIDINVVNQVIETKIPPKMLESDDRIEAPEDQTSRLEETINEHIKKEEARKAEIRRLQAEKEEKQRKAREKRKAEIKRLEAEEEEQKNGKKRYDSKMNALLKDLIQKRVIPEEEASIYKQVFQTKTNIYLDLNPQLFKKQNMIASLDDVIANSENSDMRIDMKNREIKSDNEISYQTYGQIKTSVEGYFKQYFEDIAQNADTKLLEYSEMRERNKDGLLTEEEYINFKLLETELHEFSNGQELFSILGIEDEQIFETSDRVSNYLQEKNKVSEEEKAEIESRSRQTDREFVHSAFKGTGITDPTKLRELYYSQENVRIAEEDLETVLSTFSDTGDISHSKVGVEDFKQVAESSIQEKSLAFRLVKLASQELEKSDNVKSQGE